VLKAAYDTSSGTSDRETKTVSEKNNYNNNIEFSKMSIENINNIKIPSRNLT
jgi:hypothetical protein